jgi:hypothetical protein
MDTPDQQATFHSRLSPAECQRRLKGAAVSRSLGAWLVLAGGGPKLLGTVKSDEVRLQRPVASNRSVVVFVAAIVPANDGGTILDGAFQRSFGWPTSRSASGDVEYLVQALRRVAQFEEVMGPSA